MYKITLLAMAVGLLACTNKTATRMPGPNYPNQLIRETLDRGLVAIHQGDNVVSVSWRFSGKDPEEMAFDLWRESPGGERLKLNARPLTHSSYFQDKTAVLLTDNTYILTESGKTTPLGRYVLTKERASVPYLSIPLVPLEEEAYKNFEPNDACIGDLDGDGELEIVIKRIGANYACTQQGICPGGNILEAYKLDGTRLWQVNAGPNVRQGAQYFPWLVYDFDGDGCAEVAFKTSEGAVFGDGTKIGDTDGDGITDYVIRDSAALANRTFGKILSGPEFFSVIDGKTGKELARAPWIERGRSEDWGDDYGNRVDRQLGAVGYFDGKNPGIFWGRGYNGRSVMHAWNFLDGKLIPLWQVDTDNPPYEAYANQGNHNIRIGDVDGDGKDEVIYGACAIDHDGSPLHTTQLGHGDAMHLSDIDPSRPGLEVWQCHEYPPAGSTLRDAMTGEILFRIEADNDVGRAMSADIDLRYPGNEIWASNTGGVRSAKGELITPVTPSVNMALWWDGDLSRELLDGVKIDKWNGNGVTNLFDGGPQGLVRNNGTKANPCLIADIFGDWREEVIWRTAGNDELRIYLTPYPTAYRLPTLLEDPIYRISVVLENIGYNQPPAPGFYLGPDSDPVMSRQFEAMNRGEWTLRMEDSGTGEWHEQWFLDGERATVENSPAGMAFSAGPTLASDADHSVLWTHQNFDGDLKVEYNFTRTDSLYRFVNILYLQAEGSGDEGYEQDIARWNDKRKVPAMRTYFNHMNTYHISYAAYENEPGVRNTDYIRGRRYLPETGKGLEGTDLTPEYLSPLLFEPGVTYRMTILKRDSEILLRATETATGKERFFYFSAEDFPPIQSGRIGLRQMSGRKSVYSDFKVWTTP